MLFLYRYFDNHSIFRGIIEDFEGGVSVTEESIGEYTDTVIKGTGNLEFESFYEED